MAERPIIMQGESVLGIRDRRKTQTRRAMNPQPYETCDGTQWICAKVQSAVSIADARALGPYGWKGDTLWVRETWALGSTYDGKRPANVDHICSTGNPVALFYRTEESDCRHIMLGRWRSPLHMPRWASRLTLLVTDVRVERVQDISEEDALADGGWSYANCTIHKAPVSSLAALWDSINGKRPGCSWAANPWVWAVSFEPTPT